MEDFKVKIEIVEDAIKLEPLEPGQAANDKNLDHLESKKLIFEIKKDVKSEALECADYTGSDSNLDPPKTGAIQEELSNKDGQNEGLLKFEEEILEFEVKHENDELRLEDDELIIKEETDETELETYGSPEVQRRKKQPAKIYMCYHCSFETEVKAHLKTHMLMGIHNDIAKIKCDHCSYENKIRSNLNRHMRHSHPAALSNTSAQVKVFICDRCDFQTTKRRYLPKHTLVHMDDSEVKIFFCASCKFRTRHQASLWRHTLQKHTEDAAKYKCDSCSFQTKKRESMNHHVLNCNDMQTFKCNLCDYRTKRKRNLKKHVNCHRSEAEMDRTEVAMFSCESCSFRSRHRASLSGHILSIHTDDTAKYKCERFCRYQTTKIEYLKRHLLKCNAAPDSFKCNRCHFQAQHKYLLKKHEVIHLDESEVEMFSCQYCSFRTRRKDYVAKHTKLKHTGNAIEYK